jgi:Na+/H+ antiporter NhaD/arsenite permease-like protein
MFHGLIVFIFVIGYAAITLEHKTGVNKAASALLIAVMCWALNFMRAFPHDEAVMLHMNGHLADIAQIMVFLLGAMTIVALVDSHKGFNIITDFIRTDSKRVLLWLISLATFFISSVLDNLTTSIIMVTLLRRLLDDRNERMVFAGMIIIAANAGGAWTPIGDVTTTMLWIGGRVTSGKIMTQLLLPSLVSLIVPLALFSFSVKGSLPGTTRKLEDASMEYGAKRVFSMGVGALILVPVLRAFTGLPPYMGIMLGLGLMWVVTDLIHQERHFLRVPHILTKVDISSVLFFLGILLAVAALQAAGVLNRLTIWMDTYIGSKEIIVSTMGVVSAIIDNVPLTAALMGMYDLSRYPVDSKLWEMTAYCVGTGGSMLIIGSAAGVVVMGMEKISFSWYLKRISFPALVGYLAGVFTFLIFYR